MKDGFFMLQNTVTFRSNLPPKNAEQSNIFSIQRMDKYAFRASISTWLFYDIQYCFVLLCSVFKSL